MIYSTTEILKYHGMSPISIKIVWVTIYLVLIYSQVSFILSLVYFKSRIFQVSRPTISLSRDALRSARKKWEEWGRGAFSHYGNWGSGGDPSRLKINKTLSFRDTWNKRDLTVLWNSFLRFYSFGKYALFIYSHFLNFYLEEFLIDFAKLHWFTYSFF